MTRPVCASRFAPRHTSLPERTAGEGLRVTAPRLPPRGYFSPEQLRFLSSVKFCPTSYRRCPQSKCFTEKRPVRLFPLNEVAVARIYSVNRFSQPHAGGFVHFLRRMAPSSVSDHSPSELSRRMRFLRCRGASLRATPNCFIYNRSLSSETPECGC